MKILIVEDESLIAQRIQRMIVQTIPEQKVYVKIVSTFDRASTYLKENVIDLLFLDLNLNGADGFQLLQEAVAASFHTIVISAYQQRAIEAFEYGVIDFISKPFTYERLKKSLERFEQKNATGIAAKYLAIKKQGRIQLINPDNIKYIKALGNYSELHLKTNSKLLHDKSLENLEMILQPMFQRIHKSYLVKLDMVKALHVSSGSKYEAELTSGDFLPIGRTRYKILKDSLFK